MVIQSKKEVNKNQYLIVGLWNLSRYTLCNKYIVNKAKTDDKSLRKKAM
jgi:hypothetical protein